jgi:hypothetical protein
MNTRYTRSSVQQSLGQGLAELLGALEGGGHTVDNLRADEDIALGTVMLSIFHACPGEVVGPGMIRDAALGVDDCKLSCLDERVGRDEVPLHFFGTRVFCQHHQRPRLVQHVGVRLRGDRANPGTRSGHDRAGGDHARLDRHTELARGGIAGHDAERGEWWRWRTWRLCGQTFDTSKRETADQ